LKKSSPLLCLSELECRTEYGTEALDRRLCWVKSVHLQTNVNNLAIVLRIRASTSRRK
jgi:hypothetical protein